MDWRPMRPNPLIPTRSVILCFSLHIKNWGCHAHALLTPLFHVKPVEVPLPPFKRVPRRSPTCKVTQRGGRRPRGSALTMYVVVLTHFHRRGVPHRRSLVVSLAVAPFLGKFT